jgi:hypothetical protein
MLTARTDDLRVALYIYIYLYFPTIIGLTGSVLCDVRAKTDTFIVYTGFVIFNV